MISASLLLIYSVTAGTLGATHLSGAPWVVRAPRLAVLTWQVLAVSIMLALGAAGMALAVSLAPIGSGLADIFHLCASNLRRGYSSSGGTLTALVGLVVIGALVGRLAWCTTKVVVAARRERDTCRQAVLLVGTPDVGRGVVIIDHPMPYAFCLGGRHPRVVVTSGLTRLLNEAEIQAVLAHEAGHLAQRHHICLSVSDALFLALGRPFVGFRNALPQVRVLLELSADDFARRHAGDEALRAALAKMAWLAAPVGALAASGESVGQRLRRLEHRPRPLGRVSTALTALAAVSAIAIPLALAAAPAVTLARTGLCIIG